MRMPPLKSKIMRGSIPLKSRILVRGLAVLPRTLQAWPGRSFGARASIGSALTSYIGTFAFTGWNLIGKTLRKVIPITLCVNQLQLVTIDILSELIPINDKGKRPHGSSAAKADTGGGRDRLYIYI